MLVHAVAGGYQRHSILTYISDYLWGFYILVLKNLGYFSYFSLPSNAVAALMHRVGGSDTQFCISFKYIYYFYPYASMFQLVG